MADPVDITVGSRIRELRKARRITQSTLAREIGLTFQQIQKYEKAKNRISASKLAHIAQIFDVNIEELFRAGATEMPETFSTDTEIQTLLKYADMMDPSVLHHFKNLVEAIADNNSIS